MNCTILTQTGATSPRVALRFAGSRLRRPDQTNLFPDLRQRLHQTLDIRVSVVRRRRYPQHRCSLERWYGAYRNLSGFVESGHSVAFLPAGSPTYGGVRCRNYLRSLMIVFRVGHRFSDQSGSDRFSIPEHIRAR
jgi:hypothetical protein